MHVGGVAGASRLFQAAPGVFGASKLQALQTPPETSTNTVASAKASKLGHPPWPGGTLATVSGGSAKRE